MCIIYILIYICNGILFSHEKEGNPVICNNANGTWGHYVKWNKAEKDKYCMISLICEIQKRWTHRNSRILGGGRGGDTGQRVHFQLEDE